LSADADAPGAERLRLQRAAADLGLEPTAAQVDALLAYLDLLERWNATYNLTAVRERGQMLTQHLVDCLAAVPPLARRAHGGRLLDVGSGGGLPGVVIAVLLPGWDVTCVDAVGKKAAFVRQVAGALRLPNLHAAHARVESLRGARFDVITARAFTSLAELARLTTPLLADDGVWMAMKGRDPVEERVALADSVEVFHVEPLTVPELDAQRCLVWMRPRRTGPAAGS
jgi:16S rRNA (guanine527-N7)-methyltransferase